MDATTFAPETTMQDDVSGVSMSYESSILLASVVIGGIVGALFFGIFFWWLFRNGNSNGNEDVEFRRTLGKILCAFVFSLFVAVFALTGLCIGASVISF